LNDLRDRIEHIVRQVVMETVERSADSWLPAPFVGGRRPLIVANWKMNLLAADVQKYLAGLAPQTESGPEVAVCPPLVLLPVLRAALGKHSQVALGAQDLHPFPFGAHTGEHNGAMIVDAGADYVIVGHSERRAAGEQDELVGRKLQAALAAGLRPIVCVGEQLDERENGTTLKVLRNQLSIALAGLASPLPDPADLVVAYEPVWAIGTGRTATAAQAQEIVAFIRERLGELLSFAWAARVRILYGGSVTVDNAESLAARPDVDGFLIGGASLDPDKFSKIIARAARVKSLDYNREVER